MALLQRLHGTGTFEIPAIDRFDVGETPLDAGLVDGLAAISLFVLKDQQRRAFAEGLDDLQPELETFVMNGLVVFARVVDEQVERVLGEEELVRGVIDLLSAEVPHIQPKRLAVVADEVMPMDVDAAGRFVFFGEFAIGLIQPPQEAGLPRAPSPRISTLASYR